jgi:mRNA-degrading endonuclease YafQ of YafQ-DinJ toxin-antitoxin module
MRKIVQRTRGFEKAFLKLQPKWKNKFIELLEVFLADEFDARLKTHELKGERKNEWSFSVSHDIRAIYRKEIVNERTVLVFTFIDIGSHSRVY